MQDITGWFQDVGALATQILLALIALVHLLDWLDTVFPSLLPYTAWLTDPLGTGLGGKRERFRRRATQEGGE